MSKVLEEYRLLYDLVLHESMAVWDTGQLFLIANTFLAAIIGTNFPDFSTNTDIIKRIIFCFLVLLGFTISILWYFSFTRTRKYYKFRMAQARAYEKENKLSIFSGVVELLAKGKPVKVKEKGQKDDDYDLRVLGRNWSSLDIVSWVIKLFILFYSIVLIIYIFSFSNQAQMDKSQVSPTDSSINIHIDRLLLR
jgi:hypothetical protein